MGQKEENGRKMKTVKNDVHQHLLNHLHGEFGAVLAYSAVAAQFAQLGLDGWAEYMRKQSEQELGHAQKVLGYLTDRRLGVVLQAQKEVDLSGNKDPKALVAFLFEKEKEVSKLVETVYAYAYDGKDFATMQFELWFLNEQVEEEARAERLCQLLEGLNPFAAEEFLTPGD